MQTRSDHCAMAACLQARDRFKKTETKQPAVEVAGGGIGSYDILGKRAVRTRYLLFLCVSMQVALPKK